MPRPAEFGCIRAAVLQRGPRVGVVGMGGAGKSALAAVVVHDREVAKRFRYGIAWIDVGGDRTAAQVQQLQRQLAGLLGDRDSAFTTVEQWRDHLTWLLADRSCLVVLNNVWDRAVLDAFDIPRTHSTILFTFRDHRLVEAAGAAECSVDRLDPDQARTLLARWASTDQLPAQADQICAEVGDLALGVAMAGAMVKRGLGWDHVLHRLRSADLDRIRAGFPDYPHPTLLAAIEISISAMPVDHQRRYRELAVFAGQGPVPEKAIVALWASDGFAAEDVRELLADYADRSLAWRTPDGTVSLHDLHLDVATVQLQRNAGGLRAAHRKLLDGYSARCSNSWASGPNDGYFYQHLLHHLAQAGREQDRRRLLLDFDWRHATLVTTDVTAVLANYSDPGQDEAVVAMQEALQLATHVLAHNAHQLPAQLVSRLDDHHHPAVRALVAQACRFDASRVIQNALCRHLST